MTTSTIVPAVWDTCEDCMGSGRNCSCYDGRWPVNAAARAVVHVAMTRRADAVEAWAERAAYDDHGDFDHEF